jgi:uncharacterized protein
VAMKVMAGSIKLDRSYDFERAKAAMGRPGAALAALKWSLRVPYMHTAIPSIKDADQLEENLRAMREPYAGGDGTLLAAVSRELRPVYCRMCGSCKGTCPQGLPVSDMLRVLTYAEGYGEFGYARTNWQELPEPAQAVRCGDCAGCAVRCPNGVRVQERLSRAQELFC